MHLLDIHRQQGEPGIVGLEHGAAGTVFEDVAGLEILVIEPRGLSEPALTDGFVGGNGSGSSRAPLIDGHLYQGRLGGGESATQRLVQRIAAVDGDCLDKAAEPSLLAGLLVDARGERLTPSHAVKKGRRYRYYVSAALITDAGTDREGWRLAAREIEEAVIRILADALTSPAGLVERFGAAGIPGDQIRKLLSRAARVKAALGGSPGERAKLVRELVEKIIVDERTIIIKLRRSFLLGIPSSASEAASEGAVELTAAVAFTRRGAETKLVLPGLAPQKHSSKCDPALIKAIVRGRAWFEELATGRARSLQVLAERDGISRRYIRRLIGLAFLSPELIEAILQGRQPVALTATRLTELDLPLDWTEQHKLLAG